MTKHFEVTQDDVDEVADQVYTFWRNLLFMVNKVGCVYATYSFRKRDVTLENAYCTIAWQRGWGEMAAEQADKIRGVVLEKVQNRLARDKRSER